METLTDKVTFEVGAPPQNCHVEKSGYLNKSQIESFMEMSTKGIKPKM